MKKLFLAILVAATMVACAKNEVVKQAQGDAITFADAFVDNSVRAAIDGSYTTNSLNPLNTFTVYGTVTNAASQSANIFEDVVVTRGGTGTGSSWTYGVEHTQYWIENNTYNFAAVVDGTTDATAVNKNSLGMPVNVVCTNASAQKDILYAESAPIAYQKGDNTEVKFTFSHLMSKVKFTAKNVMTTDNGYTYQVKDVRINNATLRGTYTFATEAWTDQAGAYTAEFGNVMDNSAVADMKMGDKFESNYERLLIPGEQTLNITADIELYRNGVCIETKPDHAMDVAVTLAAGKAYNFVVSLGNPGEPITFALEKVTDWVEESVAVNPTKVATAAELAAALANGEDVVLTADVTVDEPLQVAVGKNVIVDLGGKTLTAGEKASGRHHYAIDNYGTLTLTGNGAINARGVQNFGTMTISGNLTITNVDTNGGSAIWNEGKLTINGGTFATNETAGAGSYGSALNTQANGEAVVNGGTFIANSQLTYAIVNMGKTTIHDVVAKGKHGAVAGDSSATTEIYGGSFELLENPGVSDHCAYCVSAIYGGKFTLGANTDNGAKVFYDSTIADGYEAVEDNGWYTVVKQ